MSDAKFYTVRRKIEGTNKVFEDVVIKCDPAKHAEGLIKSLGKSAAISLISGLAKTAPKGSFWPNANGYIKNKYKK